MFILQMELNKKREAELQRLKRELDDTHAKTEQMTTQLKKKSHDALNELTEQLEAANKAKSRFALQFLDPCILFLISSLRFFYIFRP